MRGPRRECVNSGRNMQSEVPGVAGISYEVPGLDLAPKPTKTSIPSMLVDCHQTSGNDIALSCSSAIYRKSLYSHAFKSPRRHTAEVRCETHPKRDSRSAFILLPFNSAAVVEQKRWNAPNHPPPPHPRATRTYHGLFTAITARFDNFNHIAQ